MKLHSTNLWSFLFIFASKKCIMKTFNTHYIIIL